MESLSDHDAGDRADAARDLGECGDRAAGLELLAHLEGARGENTRAESDPEVIAEGLRSLASLHRQDPFDEQAQARVRTVIDRALSSEVELVRLQAARIAGDFLDDGLRDRIIALLEGRRREILFEVRLLLLEALGRVAPDEKTRALWRRIADDAQEDDTERSVALRLLREHPASVDKTARP